MTRWIWLFILCLLVPSAADAQGKFRGVRGHKTPIVVDAAPIVQITAPTPDPTLATSAASINISWSCTDDRGDCGQGTWACPTCTPTSGTATLTNGVWTVTATGSLVVGQDAFTSSGADAALTATTPAVGGPWTEVTDTNANDTCQVYAASNSVGPSATRSAELLMCGLALSQALSGGGSNFHIDFRRADVALVSNAVVGIYYGRQDASNFCAVKVLSGTSNNLQHTRVTAGSATNTFATPNFSIATTDTVTLRRVGTTISVEVNGVQKMSFTSSAPCTTADGGVGVLFGWTSGSNAQYVNSRIDDFTVTDDGASTSGITLASGANVITVTGTDSAGNPATDVLTVTKGASDTQGPSAAILVPTGGDTHTVATAALTVSGTALDNVAVTSVAWTCPQCSVTSGTATGTASWTFDLTLGCSAGGTANVVTVTPADAAMNSATADVLTVTCDSTDVTDPAVTITSDGGSGAGVNYSTSSATVTLVGTASDAGGSGLCSVGWVNAAGGTGTASGTINWNVTSIPLTVGPNDITVTALDCNNNDATDTITITRTAPTLTVSTTSLPGGVVGTAYSASACLAATGGTPPYTWTLFSGTLPSWATLVSGCITGTPDAAATTSSLVFRATDSVAATANSGSLSITIAASGTGDPFYATMTGRADVWTGKSADLRSQTTINGLCGNGVTVLDCTPWITYDFAGDSDAHKQNAAKFRLPFWNPTTLVLAAAISSTATDFTSCTGFTVPAGKACISITANNYPVATNQWLKIDNEIFLIAAGGEPGSAAFGHAGTAYVVVTRAHNGTSAATHSNGAAVSASTNSMPRQLKKLLSTDDTFTYFFTWDAYWTDSWLGTGDANFNHKGHHFTCTKSGGSSELCFQVSYKFLTTAQTFTVCSATGAPKSIAFDPATDVAIVSVRSVTRFPGGGATWSSTNGQLMGPGMTLADPWICPVTNLFVIKANTWTRFYMRLEQRANDYDYITLWASDETQNPVKLLTDVPYSVDFNPMVSGHGFFQLLWEFNSSVDEPQAVRKSGSNQYGDFVIYNRWFTANRQSGTIGMTTLDDATLASSGALDKPTQ